ncbi:MAG TPA: carbohydrate-binding domain-containing protein [Verrucomicrobiae bacterium]|nr:carbohydrate-binding domain-containing protein [Verrucomicrobiae bacterium]
MQDLHLETSYLQFNQVGDSRGGEATVGIHYAAASKAKLKLFINGVDYSFLNTPATGATNSYTGQSFLTVPLGPGNTNVVKLAGGHGGINVDYITVSPLQ